MLPMTDTTFAPLGEPGCVPFQDWNCTIDGTTAVHELCIKGTTARTVTTCLPGFNLTLDQACSVPEDAASGFLDCTTATPPAALPTTGPPGVALTGSIAVTLTIIGTAAIRAARRGARVDRHHQRPALLDRSVEQAEDEAALCSWDDDQL